MPDQTATRETPANSARQHATTALSAALLLAAVGYLVLLSPWQATATVAGAECTPELTWHSDLYTVGDRHAEPGAALADPAYHAGCADRAALPEQRVLSVYRLPGSAPGTAFVDGTGRVWTRVR